MAWLLTYFTIDFVILFGCINITGAIASASIDDGQSINTLTTTTNTQPTTGIATTEPTTTHTQPTTGIATTEPTTTNTQPTTGIATTEPTTTNTQPTTGIATTEPTTTIAQPPTTSTEPNAPTPTTTSGMNRKCFGKHGVSVSVSESPFASKTVDKMYRCAIECSQHGSCQSYSYSNGQLCSFFSMKLTAFSYQANSITDYFVMANL